MSGTSYSGSAPLSKVVDKGRRFWLAVLLFAVLNAVGIWWIRDVGLPRGVMVSVAAVSSAREDAPTGVRVAFSRDVVAMESSEQPDPSAWIRLLPETPGSARWLSPRELIFEPVEPLLLSHSYKLTLAPPHDLPGQLFEGPLEFEVRTPPLKFLNALQVDARVGAAPVGADVTNGFEDAVFRLVFNGRVLPASLSPHLKVMGQNAVVVNYTILTQGASREIDIRLRPEGSRHRLVLGPTARSTGKALELEGEQAHFIHLTEALQVTRMIPGRSSLGPPALEIYFTNSITMDGATPLASFFSVEPPLEITATPRWSSVRLDGEFKAGSRYRITVKKGLSGHPGHVLQNDVTHDITFPDREPTITFAGQGTFLSSQGNLSLLLRTVNVKTASLQAWRVHANNLVHAAEVGWPRESLTRQLDSRLYHLQPGLNEPRDLVVDLRDLVGGDPRGVWYVKARSGPGESDRAEEVEQLVSVSDIGISVKESVGGLMAWTVSLKTGAPLAGVVVGLRSRSNQLIQEKTTREDGVVIFDQLPDQDGPPHVVIASWENDLAYLDLAKRRVSKADFDVGGRPYLRSGNEAFLHLDRGVYRPGEKVHLRGLVRGVNAALPGSFPVAIETLRPDGKRYRLEKYILSAEGAVDATVELTPSAPTGLYTVRLRLPGEEREVGSLLGEKTFRVEEYMPQRLRVEVTAGDRLEGAEGPTARLRPGETVDIHVRASHLFGLPAADAPADVSWSLIAMPFSPRSWRGFRFGEAKGPRLDNRLEARSLVLDANGEAGVKIELPPVDAASPLALKLEARVTDVGGRGVSGGLVIPIDPAPHYLGLRVLAGDAGIERGKAVRFECAAVTPDGVAATMDTAELVVQACSWSSVLKRGGDGRYHYESREELREVARQRVVFASGRGAFELTFPDWGAYRLRLKDPASPALAELAVYSGGPGAGFVPASLENPERLEISFAKDAYRPGDVALVTVRAPFAGCLLLTLESDQVHWYQVVRMSGSAVKVDVPLPQEASVSFFLGATVVRGIDPNAEWLPHRAFGIERVPLDLSARRLTVTLDAASEARPESNLSVRVQVAREDGEPVEGVEVLLAAVDEGILALTREEMPDPFGYFYGRRAHAVETSDTFLDLLQEVPLMLQRARPGGDGGGDGGDMARRLSPVNVKRVTPAVLWLGPYTTGADGAIHEALRLPAITGELRLTAVASRQGSFGSTRRPLVLRTPFFFELGMPRFLAPGDLFQVPVSVFNRAPKSGIAELVWTLDNLYEGAAPPEEGLAFASSRDSKLELPAGGAARASIWMRAGEHLGKASARLVATCEKETRAETVDLPVRPAAPLVVSTASGWVTEAQPLRIDQERSFVESTRRWRLVLADFPHLDLAESLQYLIEYPHGCLEQTTSRVLPLLYLKDLVEATGALVPEGATQHSPGMSAIDGFVNAGISRVLDMQSEAGWLSMYPGGRQPATWASVYATHFLVEARSAGYAVPEAELDAALRYITEALVRDPPAHDASRVFQAAHGAYVLAVARRADRGAMDRLRELTMSSAARCFLAAAYHLVGDRDGAERLLLGELAVAEDRTESGGAFCSPARDEALVLNALVEVNPSDARIPGILERLRARRKGGRWRTTQENAFALLALGKYARVRQGVAASFSAEVTLPGQPMVTMTPGASLTFHGTASDELPEVRLKGPGQLHYWFREEGVPVGGKLEEVDQGLVVRRELLNTRLQPLDPEAIPMGEDVIVKWTILASETLENVVITDLLPAGLEVENPRIGGNSVRGEDKDLLQAEYVSLRDDRVLGFFSVPGSKRCVYFYSARAVTRGEFVLPPITAEAMYLPEVRSLHGAGRVVVK